MQINFVYDASVDAAPAEFKSALNAAARYLDALIANAITVTIQIGWGENNGVPITNGLANGGPVGGRGMTYAQLKSELAAHATTATDSSVIANLPNSDPTGGGIFFVTNAQAKAWGLLFANSSEIDGSIAFGTTVPWDYNQTNRAVSGESDFIGAAEHELTHAFGRFAGLQYAPNIYTPLDLFRFSSPGVLQLAGGQPAYFSTDGGKTNLISFDTALDYGDWSVAAVGDSFGYSYSGTLSAITPVDVNEMDALGFAVITPATLGLPVFRFFDTHDGGHFFTSNTAERDHVRATLPGMTYEGFAYKAADPTGGDPNALPIFRFFDPHDGGHFFTINPAERDQVLNTRPDLRFEGVGFSEHAIQEPGDSAVYRFFETTVGGHFFTSNVAERDNVLATRSDMRFEGIAFYAPT